MKLLDHPAIVGLIVIGSVAIGGYAVVRDLGPSKATDYCAVANFRTCTVTERGEWLLVTTPDGKHMVYLQGGKVVQVQ